MPYLHDSYMQSVSDRSKPLIKQPASNWPPASTCSCACLFTTSVHRTRGWLSALTLAGSVAAGYITYCICAMHAPTGQLHDRRGSRSR